MRVTLLEWAIGLAFVLNIIASLLGAVFPEGTPEQKQQPKQTQSAPAPSTDEIQSDWK